MALYSHSKLGTFETCKLQYKLKYIDKIKTDMDTVEKHLGTVCHDVLEKLYKDLLMGKLNSREAILGLYEKLWEKDWHEKIVIVKQEYDASHYWKRGQRSVSDYYDYYYPFNQGKTIGLERRVMFNLDPDGKHKIQGYIDRLVDAGDGVYEIHDYKTASHPPTDESLKEDRQLALYQIDVQEKFEDAQEVKLIWHYLTFGKEFSSRRTQEELDELKKRTIELIDTIEATAEFEPEENPVCPWCEYQPICPVRKHLCKVETLSLEDYMKEDGVKLVNRFVELQENSSRIEKELDVLKQAIFEYAKQHGYDALVGKNYRLKLGEESYMHFPGTGLKDKPLRDELVGILKEIGKFDEVSGLDLHALNRMLKHGKWDKEVVERIMKFGTMQTTRRISRSKLKDEEKIE